MRWLTFLVGVAGFAAALAIVIHEGAGRVFAVLAVGGWSLLWLAAFHVLPIALPNPGR